MLQKLPDLLRRHPYSFLFILMLLLLGPFMFAPSNLRPWHQGDLSIYINVAQNMFSGGVLYRDAIDTKNMGFFFLFYGLYALYAQFFTTMAYFFIFHAVFLFLWYWLFACLFYKTLCMVYSPLWAWLSSASIFAVFFIFNFMYFISQPQVALMLHLLYVYTALRLKDNRGLGKYGILGALLGLSFAVSAPYGLLVFTIPIIAAMEESLAVDFSKYIKKGVAAFFGFVLPVLPFFLYFHYHRAIDLWLYWNLEFPRTTYLNIVMGDFGFLEKIGAAFFNMFFANFRLSLLYFQNMFFVIILNAVLVFWLVFLWKKVVKNQRGGFPKEGVLLFVLTFPAVLVRLSLIRPNIWYNLYLIPFLFAFFPLYWKSRPLSSKIFCGFIAPFYLGSIVNIWLAHKQPPYPDAVKHFIQNNPDKKPTYISIGFPSVYSYDTRWRSVYYNMYDFLDPADIHQKILTHKPDFVFLSMGDSFTFYPTKELKSYLDANYKPVFKVPSNDTGTIECFARKADNG